MKRIYRAAMLDQRCKWDRILALAGDVPRVELFARRTAPGWDLWGNEVKCDLAL